MWGVSRPGTGTAWGWSGWSLELMELSTLEFVRPGVPWGSLYMCVCVWVCQVFFNIMQNYIGRYGQEDHDLCSIGLRVIVDWLTICWLFDNLFMSILDTQIFTNQCARLSTNGLVIDIAIHLAISRHYIDRNQMQCNDTCRHCICSWFLDALRNINSTGSWWESNLELQSEASDECTVSLGALRYVEVLSVFLHWSFLFREIQLDWSRCLIFTWYVQRCSICAAELRFKKWT